MSYHGIDMYQHAQMDTHLDDWNEDFGTPHWQGHLSGFQRPFERQYPDFNRTQLAGSRDWFRDLNNTPPACHLPYDMPYSSYQSPEEDPHRPYYNSSSSTLYENSSTGSDRLSPSTVSRASSLLPSSQPCQIEAIAPELGLTSCIDGEYANAPCVAMQNVQKTADMLNEEPMDDFNIYSYEVQEPQELIPVVAEDYNSPSPPYRQPPIPIARMDTYDESQSEQEVVPEPESESEYEPGPAAPTRRRRASKPRLPATTHQRNRVTKRPSTQRPTSPTKPPLSPRETPRAFLCPLAPYGCTATFNAKNEWKRHASTQHFRLGFWRCDQCNTQPERPNDFNRKDLFVQHVRRMHPANPVAPTGTSSKRKARTTGRVATVESALNSTAERCYHRTHEAPESCCCVFCEEGFEGEGALEARTEHVGKHMESRKKEGLEPVDVRDWREDRELEAWLLRHELVVKMRGVLEVLKK